MEWYSNARRNTAGIFITVIEDEADFVASPFYDLWNYTPPQSAGTPSPFGNLWLGAEQGASVKNPP